MANVIKPKRTSVAGKVPTTTDLQAGEIALNMADGLMFYRDTLNNIKQVTSGLGDSGVTAGTYKSVTVDTKGRVTAGANPTTISGYGITDAYTKTEIDGIYGDVAALLDTINGEVI